jgi:hypothetical protein
MSHTCERGAEGREAEGERVEDLEEGIFGTRDQILWLRGGADRGGRGGDEDHPSDSVLVASELIFP